MSHIRRFGALFLPLLVWSAVGCSKDVKIGAVISETGAVAPYGHKVTRGLDLALEEINAAGGFKGGIVELIYRDDASNPETGAKEVEDLIKNHDVRLVIGAISSPVTLSIAPICEKNGVLLLSPSSSAPQISTAGEYIFRNYPSDVLEGTAMADFAKGQRLRRLVVFALDNEFGAGLKQIFTDRFESKSRKVVQTFDIQEGRSDFSAMIEEVKGLAPEGIYIAAYQQEMVALLQQIHAADIRAMIMASASVTQQVAQLAGEAAEYLVYPQPSFDVDSSDPAVSAFVKAFREKYKNQEPDIYAAHGYDALKLVLASMEKTGTAHPDDVRRGLLGLEFRGAAGRTAFDEMGDVVRYPQKFVVRDGQPIPLEKFEQEGGKLSGPGSG